MIRLLPKSELKALSLKAEADCLTQSDLAVTCEQFDVEPRDVLNELAVSVAEGYLQGALTYDFCDTVMNGMINVVVDLGMTNELPEPAYSLYHAFDQGEWIRSSDPPETEPSEKYTKPMVQEIMRSLKG